ncbi:polyamine transporter tpo5 [Friedmanniomyces endolithicus]|uniref:Polyamine transporter tpo5 n=1 Tax=Friedmanniomyces endolithicus TaxID=329885 RepID=A0AAN6FKU6_9PEZI|nr:polyamine transporter tpo5 [Friedmanniomyces endolithicus]KAK1004854.1 polyamine transporter tpo5 [Friedmanniomyces endolithicus]
MKLFGNSGIERADDPDTKDEGTLAEQGYKQELRRDWSLIHNFGVSFSIISVITGVTTLFEYGLTTGGPGVMSIGWIVVSFFTLFAVDSSIWTRFETMADRCARRLKVGLAMAEITSAHPTSGGPYFWAAMLSPNNELAAFFSWTTGWINFVGQFAVTTGITFGCANLIATLATVKGTFVPTPGKILGIHAALLISHGLVNTFGVHILRYLNNSSITFHSLGVFAFATAIVAKAPTHQSAKFVFATFYDGTGTPGWATTASPAYVACIGILMSQYTITGFDASAHLSEETRNASWSAPLGVLTSIICSSVFGFFLILCLLFSIQDFDSTIASTVGQPVLQILLDIFSEDGAIVLFTLVIICVWHCGLFSMTSNSRMMFAFSRDHGIPRWFHYVDARFHSPVRTIWLAATLAFILALPSLGSSVAFAAATSIATIALYVSYGLPILIGLIWHKNFKKGPFNLGVFSRPVALVACLWIGFISIIFCLPNVDPVTSQTLNYTPVAVGIVALWTFGSWFAFARKYFTGPIRQIQAEEAGVDIDEPGALERAEIEGKIDKL